MDGSPELRNGDALAAHDQHAEVHQAAGMLMEQLGVTIDAANDRLRAYALAVQRPLIDVARDVISHHLQVGAAET